MRSRVRRSPSRGASAIGAAWRRWWRSSSAQSTTRSRSRNGSRSRQSWPRSRRSSAAANSDATQLSIASVRCSNRPTSTAPSAASRRWNDSRRTYGNPITAGLPPWDAPRSPRHAVHRMPRRWRSPPSRSAPPAASRTRATRAAPSSARSVTTKGGSTRSSTACAPWRRRCRISKGGRRRPRTNAARPIGWRRRARHSRPFAGGDSRCRLTGRGQPRCFSSRRSAPTWKMRRQLPSCIRDCCRLRTRLGPPSSSSTVGARCTSRPVCWRPACAAGRRRSGTSRARWGRTSASRPGRGSCARAAAGPRCSSTATPPATARAPASSSPPAAPRPSSSAWRARSCASTAYASGWSRKTSMAESSSSSSGTATVLFTDLVGSTELRSRLGDVAADALRRAHDALLADAVGTHRGTVVKHLGDGIMASFTSAADALTAAVTIQQVINRHNRRAPEQTLSVRVGISGGDVTWENGDCFGAPVIEASRLCAAANGGQILVADLVRGMARSRGGHTFTSVGELKLKGLPEPLPACEVKWEPLVEATPLPPRVATAPPVAMVGRAPELELIARAYEAATAGQRQIVLLAGEPGIGKTRLATEAALAYHAAGATVLLGTCDEDASLPYQPFVEALRHYVAHAPEEVLRTHVAEHRGEIGRLIPELGKRIA